MRTILSPIFLLGIALSFNSCKNNTFQPVDYVDPFIGTSYHGHVYPGATVPFGMVQLSPDNGTNGWDWCSGYHYSDTVISGFSHTHLSGTGIGDLADILFLPTMDPIVVPDTGFKGSIALRNRSVFSHDNESAEPGYYSVELNNGVKVELTATDRCGMQQYTAQRDGELNILIDLGFAINWDKAVECNLSYSNNSVSGLRRSTGWAKDQYQYFYSSFSKKPSEVKILHNGSLVEGNKTVGNMSAMVLVFNVRMGDRVLVKTGLSAVDTTGALTNLQSEIPYWDFKRIAGLARTKWNNELGAIKAESADPDILKVFYTSLYHSFLAPVLYSDFDGRYRGADGKIHEGEGGANYTVFSLWDTFRAAHPLYTIVEPSRVPDMINSMLRIYEQQGKLPVWSLMANETNTMIGYHAVPVIADAMGKGFTGFDYDLAYKAAQHSANIDFRGLNYFREYGYVPSDLENESVSKSLEYCYDDWCIAQIASIVGDSASYNEFIKRSENYKNNFDPSTRFMRGRLSDGSWKEPFDPLFSNHRQDDYTEGNAWQYTWFVPHDLEGLAGLMGGKDKLFNKLDSLFILNEGVRGDFASSDISGLIGAYAHGNEPGHHTAYIYSVLGQPSKSEKLVRRIMKEMYTPETNGLCGNEDCGQMSAWYVFSAMGFYPVNPADGRYYFGSPLIDKAEIMLPGKKIFTVVAHNNSDENIHVSKISLNGNLIDRNYITYKELMAGGSLEFYMTTE